MRRAKESDGSGSFVIWWVSGLGLALWDFVGISAGLCPDSGAKRVGGGLARLGRAWIGVVSGWFWSVGRDWDRPAGRFLWG